jgi:beta-mannosidase
MQTAERSRRRLDSGWALLAAAPAAFDLPQALPEVGWVEVTGLSTVPALLRAAGRSVAEWSAGGDADALDWWFCLRFDVESSFLQDAQLQFDGLATIAQVWLNGEALLSSDNMFVAARCAVAQHLRSEGNVLTLCFRSMTAALARRRPRPAWRVPMLEQQQLRWHRTSLMGRAPGWMPPTPPLGPWRDIWLSPPALVDDVELQVRVEGTVGWARLGFETDARHPPLRAVLVVSRGDQRVSTDMVRGPEGRWQADIAVNEVALWWPHTHGDPARYRVHVELHGERVMHHELGHIGFRTIEIDTRDDGFSVLVNGVAVFCRGACWMPPDPIGWRPEAADVQRTVEQARDAGMNMLRVSGTMVYEGDDFLDACDALGVMVWQDLMFANMDYPASEPAWLASIHTEVAAQLKAWQRRPSVAVVCGNSEVSQQAAMWGAPRDAWSPTLFHQTLPALVAEALPGTAYWPSSAWGGAFAHQPDAGTSSYYGVGAYLRPLADARRSRVRFATECLAFSNVPSAAAIARMPGAAALRVTHAAWKARAPRDLTAGWDFEDVRDHYVAELFGVDPARLRYDDHERYLALGRAATGEVMASAYSEWRRAGSECGGALVWFLRDLWAGAGWGLLDETGAPKACFHALRRVLQARAVVLTDEGNSGLVAHLVNERPEVLCAQLSFEAWRGDTRVFHGKGQFDLAPRSVEAVPLISLVDHFADLNHAYRFGPLAHDVVVVRLDDGAGANLAQAHHFPAGMGLAREADLGLDAASRPLANGRVEVVLTTRRFAVGVHFEAPGYQADDEFFHLAPGQTHRVTFCLEGAPRPWWGRVMALNAASGAAMRVAP